MEGENAFSQDEARKAADAILAIQPDIVRDMVVPLVWELRGDWDYKSGLFDVYLFQGKPTPVSVWVITYNGKCMACFGSKEAAENAANLMNAAQIMTGLGMKPSTDTKEVAS